ncbi:helix-turn-helix domain-containing protein [Thermoactinospora rubra]|uniref:helix-turn-helix domain-containing protein n=1 Tax=Thermoactinospora rubra TaxID=1088767 RepID=UPI00117F9A9E|nr:helix-turn-helix transcriptional regulator [Thermoactinospora rubra]
MGREFAEILRGLMNNRNLSPRAMSRASARAESTINQLLSGRIEPRAEILEDIAPVLQMSLTDLLAIAGISIESAPSRAAPFPASAEIGQLVAAASYLTPQQIQGLIDHARALKAENESKEP